MTRTSDRSNRISEHPRQCDCPRCLQEWAEWMENKRVMDCLQLIDAELRQLKPATDAEWQAFMDRKCPKVQP